MQRTFAAYRARAWVALCGLMAVLTAGSAGAELVGLAHDTNDASLKIVSIDSGNGQVTPGATSAPDCCRLPAGLTAVDEAGNRIFAVGEFTGGPEAGNTALFEFALDGSAVNSVVLAEVPRAVLAWDGLNGRLISLRLEPEAVLLSVDPSAGSVSAIGGPAVDCCEIVSGVAAIDSTGQRLFVAGRDFNAADWSLLSFDLGSGAVSTAAALPPGQPGFMLYDEASDRVEVLMQTALADPSALVAIDPVSGASETLATHSSGDCCLYSPGDVASYSQDGEAVWAAGAGDAGTPAFMGLFASGTDRPVDPQALEAGYFLHALVVDGFTVAPGTVFRDRFEQP